MEKLMPVDPVNISSEDSLIGDLITQRIRIAEVAFSRGASSTFTRLAKEMMEWWLRGSPPPTHPGRFYHPDLGPGVTYVLWSPHAYIGSFLAVCP
jgi:hypothetical protein